MIDQNKLEWLILDSMADDLECVASIWPHVSEEMPEANIASIMPAIDKLYQRGFIGLAGEIDYDKQKFMDSPVEDCGTDYWFGLKAAGCAWWEEHALRYSGEPVDWSRWTLSHVDFEKKTGYVEGVSEQACVAALPGIIYPEGRWCVDMSLLRHSSIPGIEAKYYKYIPGGHRIDFNVKLRT